MSFSNAVVACTLQLLHPLEDLCNLFLCLVASGNFFRGHFTLRLLNEVKVRHLHHDLAIGVPQDELTVSVALISRFNCLDALAEVSLLLLMETLLVVLVAEVVD